MMASPSELSLDCKPHSYSMLLKSFGEQTHDHTQKLEDFLSRLEEERLKIDAFKRELPLCMQLLTNAMEASRQQLQAYRANQVPRPVLEEFMPLKNSTLEGSEKASNISDKANWMTSAQLWSQGQPTEIHPSSSKEMDIGFNVSPKLSLDSKQRNGGAFLPFSKERPNSAIRALPDLALASPEKEMELDKKCSEVDNGLITCGSKVDNGGGVINTHEQGKAIESQTTTTTTSQNHRKARRCWSPDLHRRFVNALQMLGGSQVATPKQIRELMKVDGLTNDEVKSHLQKYRLHTRRPGPSPQPTGTPGPQLVVLGGIWVPSEYAAAAAAHSGGSALYGAAHHPSSHAMPPQHYCAPPQDHYYQTAPHQQLHHHTLHHQLHVYNKASSQTHTSPESDVRGTGDRSESIEDGKSESGSWNKGDSGENGGERRGLLALREDGEESINGSDITLKF